MSVDQAKIVDDQQILKRVRALANMYKKKAELQAEIGEIDEKIVMVENSLHKRLGDGAHKVHNWAVKISTKVIKGRKTPSWSKIAQQVKKSLEIVKNNLTESHSYSEEIVDIVNTYFMMMTDYYDRAVEENTKIGNDSEKTNIELMRL